MLCVELEVHTITQISRIISVMLTRTMALAMAKQTLMRLTMTAMMLMISMLLSNVFVFGGLGAGARRRATAAEHSTHAEPRHQCHALATTRFSNCNRVESLAR